MTTTAAVAAPHVAGPPELPTLTAASSGRGARASAPAHAALDAFVGATAQSIIAAAGNFVLEQSGLRPVRPPAAPKTTTPKELAFLDDPKMSVHEKVFRLLMYLSAKYDREVEAQMKKIKGSKASGGTEGTAKAKKKRKKSFFGKAMDKMKFVFPAVGLSSALLESPAGKKLLQDLSGPVLAAACVGLGMPQLAPLAAQLGPSLIDGAAEAQEALLYEDDEPSRKAATSGGSSSSGTAASTSESKASDEKEMAMELEYLLEKQKTMTGLLSNAMRCMHETSMAVVNNIR